MKKNVFVKILATYVAVIVFTMSVVGGLLLFMLQNYLLGSKEKELKVRSQDLASVVQPLLVNGQDPHPVITSLNRADRTLGTEIWVINKNGKVLAASADHLHCEGNTLEATDLQQLTAGKTSVRRGQSQYFQEAVIRAAVPVFDRGKFIGAVILYSPVTGINDTFAKMKELFIGAALLGFIFAVVLGLFLSRYITKPIQRVTQAAHGIAHGSFGNRVVVNSQDEIGQLGESFNFMAQRLEDYEKMRKDFVANVSHELRSPLTSINGFIEALIEGKNKDEQEKNKYLSILQKETNRMSTLVNDLLEISKFDAQKVHFDMSSFPIDTVIKRAIAILKPQLDEKKLTVKTIISNKIPQCYGDEDRIEQVIHNLLENAIRYSPQGVKLLIDARLLKNEIVVEVTDNGPGIPKDEQQRVWERFYRVDKDRSRGNGGTGLGLAIVKEIIDRHGGQVYIDSEVEIGTMFGFTLPIA